MTKIANPFPGLPDDVFRTISASISMEFATLTAQGVPLNTPTYAFMNPSAPTIEAATGLAYPTKAERARRNPKVGLFFEGVAGGPVVSIAAKAAVRDADLQANVDRYVAETGAYTAAALSYGQPWSFVRQAVWYWTRIFISITPVRILWWPNANSTDQAPQRWDAPTSFTYPASDPAPASPPAPSSDWPLKDWREAAQGEIKKGVAGHLTLVDAEGFPLPFRTSDLALVDDGLEFAVAAGAPWSPEGKASLCFMGAPTFIGEASKKAAGRVHFRVERILPALPVTDDPKLLFDPTPEVRAKFMGRLEKELARRGQSMPKVPQELPPTAPGATLRAENYAIFEEEIRIRKENATG